VVVRRICNPQSCAILFKNILRKVDVLEPTLTVCPEVIVHYLEQRETVPRVGRLLCKDLVHVGGKERPEDLGVLHHKIAKPGERLRYSVVGADRENIGHRTYTVGTFPLARGDGDATLSAGPSSTQKTLLLLHDMCVKTYRNTRETKRQAFLLHLDINRNGS